jgi:hypothetical protein
VVREDAPVPQLPSTRSVLAVLQVPTGDGSAATAAGADRLRRLYAPVLPGCRVQVRWHEPARAALVFVTSDPAPLGDEGWWGTSAGDGEQPGGGPWVRWQVRDSALTVTTSGNTVATLRRAHGAIGTAWATRSLAAQALAGARPRVRREVVPEYVLLDCTLGDDDLLEGTTRLPDATVLVLSPDGARTDRWADDVERYGPGLPTTAAALRQAAIDAASEVAAVPGAALGLTAGHDSGLLAAALVTAGHRLPTFTMGWPGLPDVDGAAHRARALGLPHRALPLQDLRGEAIDSAGAVVAALGRRYAACELLEAVRTRTRWSDGNEVPRNALLGGVRRSGEPVVWLTGSGGELARALYWHDAVPGAAPRDVLVSARTADVAPEAASAFTSRVERELATAAAWGRDGASALDVVYLRSRMRNWLGNVAPLDAFIGCVPALLTPPLVRTLLDVSEPERRTGALFDAVTTALLSEAAGRPVDVPASSAAGATPRRWRRRADPLSDWRLLDRLLRHLDRRGPGLARDVMGEAWWRATRAHAPSRPYARQWLWNTVAVDVLALVAEEV